MTENYLRLLQSDRVCEATREALEERLDPCGVAASGVALCPHDVSILHAIVDRLIPTDEPALLMQITRVVTAQRFKGLSDGWRFADLPPDDEALREGLTLLETSAFNDYGASFEMLSVNQRDDLLSRIQTGAVTWPSFSAQHWFEDLLADITEIYMSHPTILERINFTGFAFLPRWERVDLNSTQPWEHPTP